MNINFRNKIGLAGEFRVMSELLLRGHNPAKSYLADGVDLVLGNGMRIEVKSSHKGIRKNYSRKKPNNKPRARYLFTLKGGGRKAPQNLKECDFIIFWCIDEDYFLIIPKAEVATTVVGIDMLSPSSKYFKYKNRWDLLEVLDDQRRNRQGDR